jgi:hypothetical protein
LPARNATIASCNGERGYKVIVRITTMLQPRTWILSQVRIVREMPTRSKGFWAGLRRQKCLLNQCVIAKGPQKYCPSCGTFFGAIRQAQAPR